MPAPLPILIPLLAMFAVQTMTSMADLTVPVLAPAAALETGVAATYIGVWIGVLYVAAMASGLVTGRLVQRHGAVRVCQIAALAAALGLGAFALAHPAAALLSAVLLGAAYGVVNPAASHVPGQAVAAALAGADLLDKTVGRDPGRRAGGRGRADPGGEFRLARRGAVDRAGLAGHRRGDAADPRGARRRPVAGPHAEVRRYHRAAAADPDDAGAARPDRRRVPVLRRAGLPVFVLRDLYDRGARPLAGRRRHGLRGGAGGRRDRPAGLGRDIRRRDFQRHHADAARRGVGRLDGDDQRPRRRPAPAGPVRLERAARRRRMGWNGLYLSEVARLAPEGRIGEATGGAQFFFFAGAVSLPPVFGAVVGLSGGYAPAFMATAVMSAGASVSVALARRRGQDGKILN